MKINRRAWFQAVSVFAVALTGLLTNGCGDETPPPPPAITSVSAQELKQLMDANADILVLDVRSPGEHASGHISGAVNIPHTEINQRLEELADFRDKHVVVCCWAGGRADIAKRELRDAGFASVLDLRGHMAEWERLGYPVEKSANE